MKREYFLPPVYFKEIENFAKNEGYEEVLKIVAKQVDGRIEIEQWEADLLLKVAKIWQLQTELKYPFWDTDHPKYDPDHEDYFLDAQDEHWGKIAMTFPEESTLKGSK